MTPIRAQSVRGRCPAIALGLGILLQLTACDGSSAAGDDDDDDTVPTIDAGPVDQADAFVPPEGSFTIDWGPVEAAPGDEFTRCVTKRLDNETAVHIGSIHNVLGAVSHHLIVYRVADGVENDTPTPCAPFTDALDPSQGSPLMITQRHEELLELPEGVAFTFQPHQLIRLEMHYINAGTQPSTLTATSTFIQLPDSEFQNEADFLFIGNPDISIGAHQDFTLGPSYFPMPNDLAGIQIFAITGHEHQWGTGVTVATTTGASGPDTTVYDVDNFNWAEPETVRHDPPFTVPAGGGFRFTCNYRNDSDNAVGFGESANDEMCFFWAYYYPSHGSKVCAHTDMFGSLDLCCPGNPQLCAYLQNL
jgi:hypothetical protein